MLINDKMLYKMLSYETVKKYTCCISFINVNKLKPTIRE